MDPPELSRLQIRDIIRCVRASIAVWEEMKLHLESLSAVEKPNVVTQSALLVAGNELARLREIHKVLWMMHDRAE